MSDPEKARHRVTNRQNQPVELHLPSGLIVLPPRGEADVDASDLESPQLRVLRKGRRITAEEIAPAAPAPPAGAAPAAKPAAPEETDGGEVEERTDTAERKP